MTDHADQSKLLDVKPLKEQCAVIRQCADDFTLACQAMNKEGWTVIPGTMAVSKVKNGSVTRGDSFAGYYAVDTFETTYAVFMEREKQ